MRRTVFALFLLELLAVTATLLSFSPTAVSAPLAESGGRSEAARGVVRDAQTNNSMSGAGVDAGDRYAIADTSGYYSLTIPTGTYPLIAPAFVYVSQTVANVVVTGATVRNFALQPGPQVVLSGTVYDATASWPLYGRLDIAGYEGGPIYNEPVSGFYSVSLPVNASYSINVAALISGYLPLSQTVSLGSVDQTANFALAADQLSCVAPGYQQQILDNRSAQDFESSDGAFATDGTTSFQWGIPTTVTAHSGTRLWATNLTGEYYNWESGYLTSPNIDLSAGAGHGVVLKWWQWLESQSGVDTASVEVSKDDGSTWTLVYGPASGALEQGWMPKSATLDPSYAAAGFRVRFHFASDPSDTYLGWYVDDFSIDSVRCLPSAGGLLVGEVFDANTGVLLPGATISNDAGYVTFSGGIVDPSVPASFYVLFSPSGSHIISATLPGYGPLSTLATVVASATVRTDFSLPSGRLTVSPTAILVNLDPGELASRQISLTNSGSLAAALNVVEVNAPLLNAQPTGPFAEAGRHVGPKRFFDLNASASFEYDPPAVAPLDAGDIVQSWNSGLANPWGIGFNLRDGDLWIGDVAAAGGDDLDHRFTTSGSNTGDAMAASFGGIFAADLAYNPLTGKLWQVEVSGDYCLHELDPSLKLPTGRKICPSYAASQRGLAYDPRNDTFYSGSWIDRVIYHFNSSGTILDSYHVDLPISGLALNPTTGHLFVLVNHDVGIGQDVYVLDANNGYAILGSFNIPAFGAFEQAGLELDCNGDIWAVNQINGQVIAARSGESVPCSLLDIPWLVIGPITGTIGHLESQSVTLSLDATSVQPGTYPVYFGINSDTPYGLLAVPITLNVSLPASWGFVSGVVSDSQTNAPIAGASVVVSGGPAPTYTVSTDASGDFRVALPPGTYTLAAGATGYFPRVVTGVAVSTGVTTTTNLTLNPMTGTVDLALVPSSRVVGFGAVFTVPIEVRAGPQEVDLVSSYLDFDPAVLRVVDSLGNPATYIDSAPGSPLGAGIENVVDNPAGHINYSVGKSQGQPSPTGTFQVGVIPFLVITSTATATDVSFTFDSGQNRQTGVVFETVSVLRSAIGGHYEILDATLVGVVTLQFREVAPPADPYSIPVRYQLIPSQPGTTLSGTVNTNLSAQFTLSGITPGVYTVKLKNSHTLTTTTTVDLLATTNYVSFCALPEGDADDNGQVNIADFSIFSAAYGKQEGQPGFDARADFNESGQINITDFSGLAANFGRHGDQPCP